VRFCLGLAEAGFFPGVIVYLTHWFPSRDRARALAWFFVAAPLAQIVSPKLSNWLLKIGIEGRPPILGWVGWQWVYIAWGIPAVVLGVVVLIMLTDRPGQARWLTADERQALEQELKREKELHHAGRHMTVLEALRHSKVLTLAAAYFFVVAGNYGIEFFLPIIFERWYHLKLDMVTSLVILPPIGSLIGQLLVGWNSDRTGERRLHAALPIFMGSAALGVVALLEAPPLWLTVLLFVVVLTGQKAYMPAFWALPSLFLTEAAAAGSIGLINSVGNLGGWVGPSALGWLEKQTGSFKPGLLFLVASTTISAVIVLALGLGRRTDKAGSTGQPDPLAEPLHEPA
jgi:ACS family tartrate transporter-like MFS transporter